MLCTASMMIAALPLLSADRIVPAWESAHAVDDMDHLMVREAEYDDGDVAMCLALSAACANLDQQPYPPNPSNPRTKADSTPSAPHSESVSPSQPRSFTHDVLSSFGSEPSWHLAHTPLVPAESSLHGWHWSVDPDGCWPSGHTLHTPGAPPTSLPWQRTHWLLSSHEAALPCPAGQPQSTSTSPNATEPIETPGSPEALSEPATEAANGERPSPAIHFSLH